MASGFVILLVLGKCWYWESVGIKLGNVNNTARKKFKGSSLPLNFFCLLARRTALRLCATRTVPLRAVREHSLLFLVLTFVSV